MPGENVAIVGGGGIGGYMAAQLAWAGQPVTLCVRTPFERLTVADGGGIREAPVRIAAEPDGIGPVRWLLITTKAQDTAGASSWVEALAGAETTVVVVQNGIRQAERVRPFAGPAAILPAIIRCSVERTRPGHVVHHGAASMVVPAGPDGQAFAGLFAGTAFDVAQDADFVTASWRKLLANVVGNAITALTLRRSDVLSEPAIRDLARGLLAEAVAAGRADGADISAADAERVTAAFAGRGTGGGSSMLYDRLAGRPLEHRYLTGAVVEAADRHGIDVPLNRAVLALLSAASGHPPDGSA